VQKSFTSKTLYVIELMKKILIFQLKLKKVVQPLAAITSKFS